MLTYLIVGAGHRARFYGRAAQTYPRLFRCMYLCRSAEKAALVQAQTGLEATASLERAEALRPDFVVVAVTKTAMAAVAAEWVERGYPVLTETPAGATPQDLALLWRLHREGKRLVTCEQYHRYPILAAGLRAVEEGRLGEPQSAYLSLCHDYHAFSLLRRMLRAAGESYTLRGCRTQSPVVETDSRQGAILDGRTAVKNRDLVHIAFASGKTAVYDFSGLQYRSYLRSRHLTLRGERGEWTDTRLLLLDQEGLPKTEPLLPDLPARYRCLDTQDLRDLRRAWSPVLNMETLQDEYAVATVLLDMGDYLQGGPEPYPFREALEDAWFWLRLEEAVAHPWQETASRPMPWE